MRCYDPHSNKSPSTAGILHPSERSNNYCLKCHRDLANQIAAHTKHEPDTPGSYCYDCHMPREIQSIVSGEERFVRTHTMSSIPDPQNSEYYGLDGAPNVCNECHQNETATWAREWMEQWAANGVGGTD